MFNWLWTWWHIRDLERRVRKLGWTGGYVGDYVSAPTWAYTIGFDETLDQPELIIFDLPQAIANELMSMAFTEIRDGALVLEDGGVWPAQAEGRSIWRKVHPGHMDGPDGWFTFALIRRARRTGKSFGLEGFQLVLSDEAGHFPWDEGYDERLRPRQPALWDPPENLAAPDRL